LSDVRAKVKAAEVRKKVRLHYQMAVEQFEKSNGEGTAPIRPKAHLDSCLNCSGSGLVAAISPPIPDKNYPHVAIIGGGIGGVALAVACFTGDSVYHLRTR
jgi:hypothetical protein